MWEEAAKISVLGVQVYAYGLYTALGAAWALAALGLRLRRMHAPKGATGLIGLCALALGLVFSRLFYCLMDGTLGTAMPLKAVSYTHLPLDFWNAFTAATVLLSYLLLMGAL